MRITLAVVALLVVCSCRPVTETATLHAVHSGEAAVLVHPSWTNIPVAPTKDIIHLLARAAESNDSAAVRDLVAKGKVFEVAANTRVRVTAGSFNEREIRIQDGQYAGKTGWVPYEWLRPERR